MQLIDEYKETLKETRALYEKATPEDKKVISGMVSDLEYAIEWLQTGRRPGNKRGIERRAAYQRERPFDPLLMQRYFRSQDDNVYEWDKHHQENVITDWEKIKIEDALSCLTKREKEIYLMSRGYCLSFSHIARYLDIKKTTVQNHIDRAERKIAQQINVSLFSVC